MRHWVSVIVLAPRLTDERPRYNANKSDTKLLCSAALCQVFDSIFMDVPMSKVKFNASGDYAYIQNFKVLQSMCALAQAPLMGGPLFAQTMS